MKIGFIGLGIMGSRMATNLQKHGCSLVMFNRSRGKAALLPCMGTKIVHAIGHGMGTSLKMVSNVRMGNAMVAFAEGMALGEGLGVSRKVLFDSFHGSPADAPSLAAKRNNIESGNYDPEF